MFRILIAALCLSIFAQYLSSQHFIGLDKDEVRQLVARFHEEFIEDESVRNPVYDLIRYTDLLENQTLLFVFDEDGKCRYFKHICDYSLLDEMIRKLDGKFEKQDDDGWFYEHQGQTYQITLKKEEWYFVLDTRKAEE